MSRPASPRAVDEVRRLRSDLVDLPDDMVAAMFITHRVELWLAWRDLYEALERHWAWPLIRAFLAVDRRLRRLARRLVRGR